MKKILITAVALALAVPALAAQQDIAQLSSVTASREALRTAINTQLSAVQANFDEVYAVIDAGPVYVNASAPADTKVVWIDTDQSNAIKVYVGGAWTVVGSGGDGSYTLPTAAADTLGGVKVGARLTITDGVLSADVQTGDGDDLGSAAYTDVVALWTTCAGYLKSDGTCDTPSGSAAYPGAGVANSTGSAWGTSYAVGTAANNLVQLNGSAQLPAVSGALLTGAFTGTLLGSETTLRGAIDTLGDELDAAVDITAGTGITIASGEFSVTTGTYQAYDANMIVWPATVDATEVGYLDGLTEALSTTLTNKQNTLVSGTSIKTINSESLLGSGNIAISGSSAYTTAPTYSDETCTAGEYALDSGYVYFCRATNTWDRVALTAWSNPSPTTPTLTSATVGTLGLTADLLFSEAVDIGSGGNGGWSMICATTGAISMTYSSGATTNMLAYSLSDTPIENEVCTISYTQPGDGVESDDDGADLATISSASVTNNSEVGGTSYADIIFYWDCDSTTANKSAGDTSASPQVDAAIDTALYQVGTGSCDSPSSYSRYDFTLNNDDLIDVDQGRVGMWVYVTENASSRTLFRAAYDANNKVSLQLFNTDLRVAMDYVAGGLGMQWEDTTPAAFELNTWFFLEFAWNKDAVGNDFQMWINGSSVLTADTASGTWSKGSSGTLSIGDFEGNGGDMHIDQVIISSDPTRDLYALRNNTSF